MSSEAPPAGAVVLTVVCTYDDPRSFCRHLTSAIAATDWTLSRAFAVARQVHPHHPDAVGTLATLMHCEFRLNDSNKAITDGHVEGLLASLAGFEHFGLQRVEASCNSMSPRSLTNPLLNP